MTPLGCGKLAEQVEAVYGDAVRYFSLNPCIHLDGSVQYRFSCKQLGFKMPANAVTGRVFLFCC